MMNIPLNNIFPIDMVITKKNRIYPRSKQHYEAINQSQNTSLRNTKIDLTTYYYFDEKLYSNYS